MKGIRNRIEGIPIAKLSEEFRMPFVKVFTILWKNRFYLNAEPESCLSAEDYEEAKRILNNFRQND